MKKFLFILLSAFVIESARANLYGGQVQSWSDIFKPNRPINAGQIGKEDHVVFPFGLEIPFPWNITQGIWLVKGEKFESYFVLQVSGNTLRPRLTIYQYDINTCRMLAAGVADNQTDQGKVLWATMKTTPQFAPYRVGIRAFRLNSFAKDTKVPSVNGQVLVITLEAMTNNKSGFHMAGQKLDNSTDMKAYGRCGSYRYW